MKRTGFIDGRRVAGWNFPASASPGNGQVVTVNDYSPGTAYAKTLNYNVLADKTALYAIADVLNVSIQKDVILGYGKRIDVDSSGDPAIAHFSGLVINMNDPGNNCTSWMCLDLNFSCVGTPTAGRYGFIKCRPHTAVTPEEILLLEGAPCATYLIKHPQLTAPAYPGAGGGAHTNHLKCLIGGTECRIPLFTG